MTSLLTANQNAGCVEFLLVSWLPGVMECLSNDLFEFSLGGRYNLNLLIRPTYERSGVGITIETSGSFPATAEQLDFTEALLARKRRLPPYIGMSFRLPFLENGEAKIDVNGFVKPGFDLPSWMLPPTIRSLHRQAEIVLLDSTGGFFGLLSRHFNLSLPTGVIKHYNLYWSFSRELYKVINAPEAPGEYEPVFTINFCDDDRIIIQNLLNGEPDAILGK